MLGILGLGAIFVQVNEVIGIKKTNPNGLVKVSQKTFLNYYF
jgi:hypothetical protein